MIIGILAVLIGLLIAWVYINTNNKSMDKKVDRATKKMAKEIERIKREGK